jgi:hemerythrin-like domain-containing protein
LALQVRVSPCSVVAEADGISSGRFGAKKSKMGLAFPRQPDENSFNTVHIAMKITEILVAEHVVLHNLFDHLEQTAPRLKSLAEIKSLSATLEMLMRAHAKTEDDLLVEPLEHCLAQIGQSDTFHEEHDQIERRMADVQKARRAKQARELLLKVVLRSREHFDKEERIVFPLAERVMKAETLSSLGNEWMKRREAVLR